MIGWTALALAGTARIGVFVGADVGLGTDEPLAYAEQEAADLARVFQDRGDLSRDRTTVLKSPRADDVREALRGVDAHVREVMARGDDVLLVFTYSGHASRQGLHLSGSVLPMDELRRWLERSPAQVRVAFVDACESGTLARVRGGQEVEAVDIVVDDQLLASGLAVITSTGPLSVAREGEQFGGGVFSRALITGLRGSADGDGDGQITVGEAYQYAFEETVVSTASGEDGIQRPEYRYEMAGIGEVVLTRVPQRAAGLVLPEELEGTYAVVSVASGQVVARVEKTPGTPTRLDLPTGRYLVRKVRREDVLLAEIDLVWGGDRWVEEAQMRSVPVGDAAARGGWSLKPWRVTSRALAATPWVPGQPVTFGGELEVRAQVAQGLEVAGLGGATSGNRWEWEGRLRATAIHGGLGLVATRRLAAVDLSVGGGALVARMSQRIDALDYADLGLDTEVFTAVQWAPGGWGQGGVHLPVGPTFGLDGTVRVQAVRAAIEDENARFLAEAVAGIGVSGRFRLK